MSNPDMLLAIADTLDYIRANIGDRTMTPKTLARRVGYSITWFSDEMRSTTGRSIKNTIMRIRLEEAARLLRETHDEVNIIARQVGYAHGVSLSNSFVQVYGCRPTAYRLNHRRQQWAERQAIYEARIARHQRVT